MNFARPQLTPQTKGRMAWPQLNLAARLASGHDLAGAAHELGVSVNTVRTQIRRMFEKTSTHNQASLVSRLLNIQGPD
jgi:DNA-binding CsgD family transcriptional regulator